MANSQINVLIEATTKGFDQVITQFKNLETSLKSISAQTNVANSFSKLEMQMKAMAGSIQTLNTSLNNIQLGFDKVGSAANRFSTSLSMQWNLKSMIGDMKQMLAMQMRWYAVKPLATALQSAIYAPGEMAKEGFQYLTEIDKYTAMLDRYAAMEGLSSESTRQLTSEMIIQARTLSTTVPIAFDKIMTSSDRLVAAGLKIDDVKNSLKSFSQLQIAFPEIEMEKFTNALVGFLNAYRDSPSMAYLADDATRLKVIMDKLSTMLAKSVLAPKDVNAVIQYLGQIGSVAGFSIDQLVAMSALVTNLGSKANVSARSLRGFLQSLTTKDAEKGLLNLGIALDRNKTIADQFDSVMTQLQQKLGTGQLNLGSLQALTKITSTERLTPLLAMISHWSEFKDLIDASANSMGGVERAAKEMEGTLGNQLVLWKNIYKEISTFGQEASTYKDIMGTATIIVRELGAILLSIVNLLMKFYNLIKSILNIIFLVAEGIGNVFQTLYKIAHLDFKGVIEGWKIFGQKVIDVNNDLEKTRQAQEAMHQRSLNILYGNLVPSSTPFTKEDVKQSFDAMFPQLTYSKKGNEGIGGFLGGTVIGKPTLDYKTRNVEIADTKPAPAEPAGKLKGMDTLISAMNKIRKAEMDMQRSMEQITANALENAYRSRLISEEEYYEQKKVMIKENALDETNTILNEWAKVEGEWDRKIKAEGDRNKKKAFMTQKEAARQEVNAALMRAMTKEEIGLENLKTQELERQSQRRISISQFGAKFSEAGAKEAHQAVIHGIELQAQKMQFLYDRGSISASQYYDSINQQAEERYAADVALANQELEDFRTLQQKKIDEAKKRGDKVGDLNRELLLKEQAHANKLNELDRQRTTTKTNTDIQRALNPSSLFTDTTKGGGPFKGFLAVADLSLGEFEKKWADTGTNIKAAWDGVTQGMAASFSELFTDMIEGKVKSLGEYVKAFGQMVLKVMADIIAKETAVAAISGLKTVITTIGSAVSAHEGGLIEAHSGGMIVPRFHGGGLNSDERNAVLLTRERVLSREQTVMMDNMYNRVMGAGYKGNQAPNVQVNVINQSSQKVSAEQGATKFDMEKMVVSVVLKDLNSNGPLFGAVRGVR